MSMNNRGRDRGRDRVLPPLPTILEGPLSVGPTQSITEGKSLSDRALRDYRTEVDRLEAESDSRMREIQRSFSQRVLSIYQEEARSVAHANDVLVERLRKALDLYDDSMSNVKSPSDPFAVRVEFNRLNREARQAFEDAERSALELKQRLVAEEEREYNSQAARVRQVYLRGREIARRLLTEKVRDQTKG